MEDKELIKLCDSFAKGIDPKNEYPSWMIVGPLHAYLETLGVETIIMKAVIAVGNKEYGHLILLHEKKIIDPCRSKINKGEPTYVGYLPMEYTVLGKTRKGQEGINKLLHDLNDN